MKKSIFIAGLLMLSGAIAAVAAPFNPKGIPATAQGIVHVDVEAFLKAPLGRAVQKEVSGATTGAGKELLAEIKEFQKDSGVDIFKDIGSITVGIIVPAQKKEPEVVGIIRGSFTPSKFLAVALKKKDSKAPEVKLVHIGKYPFLKGKAKTGGDVLGEEFLVGVFDSNTLIVVPEAKEALAKAAIAALEGTGKSFVAPAAIAAQGKQVGTPYVVGFVDGKVFGDSKPDPTNPMDVQPPQKAHFALGESGSNTKIRVALEYASAADAQKTNTSVQGMLGFFQMMALNPAGQDGKPDPKKAAEAARAKKLFDALKINVTGKALVVALDIASADIIQSFTENMKLAAEKD